MDSGPGASGWRRVLLGRRPSRTLARAAVVVAAAVVTFGWVLVPIRTYGPSMQPTYRAGGLWFVNRLAYLGHEPRRGDVVAIRLAGPRVLIVKRVLAVPGERVRIDAGIVHVDGRPLDEPYVVHRAKWVMPERVLGGREYFVAGDNRGMRIEQHDLGAVQRDRIVGRMLW
jgi:signal peptidase I